MQQQYSLIKPQSQCLDFNALSWRLCNCQVLGYGQEWTIQGPREGITHSIPSHPSLLPIMIISPMKHQLQKDHLKLGFSFFLLAKLQENFYKILSFTLSKFGYIIFFLTQKREKRDKTKRWKKQNADIWPQLIYNP